ncbi:hypothetical protein KP79_PYT12613 [Mizuhopecten yessoensis]|uniref:Uncharacterized protein n=1 Tax=Mizuhopecten yessoensis TaxID=6573 RepID=A0A210Q4X5_MIZYE|nr:hypothetical protein KP79_PYT12613 [Mizuhopecten yessoensis]
MSSSNFIPLLPDYVVGKGFKIYRTRACFVTPLKVRQGNCPPSTSGKMTAQHIWIHSLVIFEIISLAVGNQYSLSVSSSNGTWNNIHEADGACMLVSYADMVTVGKPTGDKDFGPVWLSSEIVFSEWIHLIGCFSASVHITNQANEIFKTTEKCLKFCGGNFEIADNKCICQDSYSLSQTGCLGWKCSIEDEVSCGDSKNNHGKHCVCQYVLEKIPVKQAERIGNNCVAYHSNSSSLNAHNCSDSFPSLCVDVNDGTSYSYGKKHQWTDAGHHCYDKNKQFYSPKKFGDKISKNTSELNNSIYWVAIFRINLTSTNLPSKLLTTRYCPAAVNRNNRVGRVLMPCSDHLPALCLKEQTSSTSSTPSYIHILIPSFIAGVLLIVFVSICVAVKIRRRKRATKRKAEVSLPEVRNMSLPTRSQGNDGPMRELDGGNSNNDIYNELHEERRRRPNDNDELYDHAPAGNNIYGQLHQRHGTCDESAYDSMAAIRCAEGMYGTTANRSSVTDEEYGHLAACSPK